MWVFKSVYQGMVIMVLSFAMFENSYFLIVTITFSTLVFAEILNVYGQLNKFTPITFLFTIGTLVFYFLSVEMLSEYLSVQSIDVNFAINIVIIGLICWLPFWAIKKYQMITDPDDYQSIMKLVKKQEKDK